VLPRTHARPWPPESIQPFLHLTQKCTSCRISGDIWEIIIPRDPKIHLQNRNLRKSLWKHRNALFLLICSTRPPQSQQLTQNPSRRAVCLLGRGLGDSVVMYGGVPQSHRGQVTGRLATGVTCSLSCRGRIPALPTRVTGLHRPQGMRRK
jgi:hypothetical protein